MAVVRSPHFTAMRPISWPNYVSIRSRLLYCLLLPIVWHVAIMLPAETLARFPRISLYLLLTFAFIPLRVRAARYRFEIFFLSSDFVSAHLRIKNRFLSRVLRASRLFFSRALRNEYTIHAEILTRVVIRIWKRNPRIAEYERKIREAPSTPS